MAPTLFKEVAVVGATGNLGSKVTSSLIDYGYAVRILRRHDATNLEAFAAYEKRGATVVSINYAQQDTIVAALKGAEVLVSVVSGAATFQLQPLLLEAAKAAGVKRFVPSEFGVDYTALDQRVLAHAPPFGLKLKFREQIKASGLEYTIIENGMFMEYLYTMYYGFDAANGKAAVFGDNSSRITLTATKDIGAAVPIILDNPASRNAHALVSGVSTTIGEYLAAYERVTGKKLEVSHTPVEEGFKQLDKVPADQLMPAIVLGLRISIGQGIIAITNANAWLAGKPFKFTTLDEYVATAFGTKQ